MAAIRIFLVNFYKKVRCINFFSDCEIFNQKIFDL